MRVRSKLSWILPLAALAYVALPAQGAPAGPGTGTPAGSSVNFNREVRLSPAEEAQQGEAMVQQIEANARGIDEKYRRAHDERDVVKSLCLNDKLSQANSAHRMAKERHDSLKAAASRNDAETSHHHFNILSVLKQRSDQLSSEANQCIGQESNFTGGTTVNTSIDSNLPNSNDTPYPFPPGGGLIPAPPISVSPSR